MSDSTSLTGNAAALNGADDVELVQSVSNCKGLTNDELEGLKTKVIVDVSAVDGYLTAALVNTNSCNGVLSSAGSIIERCLGFVHLKSLLSKSKLVLLRLLSSIVVLGTLVDSESGCLFSAESGVGEHTGNGDGHSSVRLLSHELVVLDLLETADPAGVPSVSLLLELAAGEDSLVAVDDDYVVAAVCMMCVGGLVLASQDMSCLSRYATERLTLGVENIPLTGDITSSFSLSASLRSKPSPT